MYRVLTFCLRSTLMFSINPVNDAPVITAGGTLTYTENDPASVIDNTITVTDADNTNLSGATAQITANYINGQDVLSFTNTANITGVFNSGTGTLTLSGVDTVPNYESALRSVRYANTSENPSTAARTVSWQVNDGAAVSNTATSTINVVSVNDAPVATNDGPYSVNEGGTLTVAAPGVLGNDTDVDSPSITAILVSGPAHASSFALNADGSFTYVHDGSETTSDSFTYKANDGSLDSNVATVTISITAVNDAPVITAGATLNYTEGDPATVIDNTITVTDADSTTLASATVQITGNYVNGQDVLSFTNTANITGSFSSATGTLTLTGVDTLANYQSALRSVKYTNTSNSPSTAPRTVSWRVNDGAGVNNLSNIATSTINVISTNTAPVLANSSSVAYFENDPATVINSVITVSDVDSPTLAGATIQITGNYVNGQDVLSFTNFGGITGSFNASTGTMTLTGTATLANYQTALRSVKYSNTSDDPSTATRTISFQVDDGDASNNLSNIINSTLTVTAVNDPPTAFAFSGLPAQAGIPITYPAGKLGGTDAEAGTTVTIDTTPINLVNVANITLNANGSFTITPVVASAGGTMSFQYRVSDNGNPAPGVNGAYVTVSFSVAGPAIYFTRSAAVGAANCTLGNECTVSQALASIGAATGKSIFIGDAGSQTVASISLNNGGKLIGQGVNASSFDALFGIGTPSEGTLAPRPAVNQPRPTLVTNISLDTNSHARGFNLSVTTGEGIVATSKTGLLITDLDVNTSTSNPAQFGVNLATSSGVFNFGNVTVAAGQGGSAVKFAGTTSASTVTFGNITSSTGNALVVSSSGATDFTIGGVTATSGQAVNVNTATGDFTISSINDNGASTGILVQNATGSFTVTGGGTVQNCTAKGADFRSSNNISLTNMIFSGNGTTNLGASCGDIVSSRTNNGPANCNANISLLSTTGVTLDNVSASNSAQIGIDGQNVSNLTLNNVTVQHNGNDVNEDGVQMANLTGTLSITGTSVFVDNAANQFQIVNDNGTLNANVTGATFRLTNFALTAGGTAPSPGSSTANGGLQMIGRGTAIMNPTVTGSTFQRLFSFALSQDYGAGSTGGTVKFGQPGAGNGNTFTDNGFGVAVSTSATGNVTYEIRNNTLTNNTAITTTNSSTTITASMSGTSSAATYNGLVDGNIVGVFGGAVASGCFKGNCNGIELTSSLAAGTHKITATNNQVYHVNGGGIVITSSGGSTGSIRAVVQNNTIDNPDGTGTAGIFVRDVDPSVATSSVGCLTISSNTVRSLWASATTHKSGIRIQNLAAPVFALVGYVPSTDYVTGPCTLSGTGCNGLANTDANAADYLSQQNPATVTAQLLTGGSSATQTRGGAAGLWTGTASACP